MIKKISGEIWKPLKFKGWQTLQTKYALSSSGRAASYKKNILEDGKLLEGSLTSGYRTLNLHVNGYNGTIYFHREIAKMFHKKTSSKQKYVIHLDHNKTDNHVKNLEWATQKEAIEHQQKNPQKAAYKKTQKLKTKGMKLNISQVKAIKTIIANPRRRLTHQQIADKYNISPMTIYRIKRGENWGRI